MTGSAVPEDDHVRPPAGSPDDPTTARVPRASGLGRRVAPPLVAFAEPDLRRTIVPIGHPVVVEGELRTAIVVERITGAQLLALTMDDATEPGLGERVRALMTNLPIGGIGALDADDAQAVLAAIRPFLPAAIRTLEDEAEQLDAGDSNAMGDQA